MCAAWCAAQPSTRPRLQERPACRPSTLTHAAVQEEVAVPPCPAYIAQLSMYGRNN